MRQRTCVGVAGQGTWTRTVPFSVFQLFACCMYLRREARGRGRISDEGRSVSESALGSPAHSTRPAIPPPPPPPAGGCGSSTVVPLGLSKMSIVSILGS